MKPDKISKLEDIGLILQSMIKTRYYKNTKIIYTPGMYKSFYISFYTHGYVWQFYVVDKHAYYMIYLLKNEKSIKKYVLCKNELISTFYEKISHFFRLI